MSDRVGQTKDWLLERSLLVALCSAIGSDLASWIKALVSANLWMKLLALEIDPSDYDSADSFADDYLLVSVLKKSALIPVQGDPERDAVAQFYACEAACKRTNASFLSAKSHPSWVFDVQQRFREILGNLTPRNLERMLERCGYGPGAAVGVKGDGAVSSVKYDTALTLTPSLVSFSRAILGELWWEHNSKPRRVVEGNEFFTVPKSALKRRGCAKEPLLNSYLQLGVGRYMFERLGLFGVDLRSQLKNQQLAGEAYTRKLATLDLSSASDLMSKEVVSFLCTSEWDHLLELARSPTCVIDGERVVLEKHSSMGNGYTFPLETAIFKAVVDSVVCNPSVRRSSTAVYGDDIIVPQDAAGEVITRLEYLGFQVNQQKSHLAGDFFESCGKDFFRGVPVRPFYARRSADGSKIPYALQLANSLRTYAAMRGVGGFCDPRFYQVWLDLRKQIPAPWVKCRVPPCFGDTGIISSMDEVTTRKSGDHDLTASQLEGRVVRFVPMRPVKVDRRTYGVYLAAASAGGATGFSKGREPRRGYLRVPKVRVATVAPWQGFAWPD